MITIRDAREEDAKALLEIYSYYVEHTAISFELTTPSLSEFKRRLTEIQKHYPYLVIEKDGSLHIQEVNKPRYNENQALVKTIACGMCGTDVKLIHRTFKGFPESVYPIMLGHEGVGEVVEVERC